MRIGLNLLFLKPGKVGGTQTYSENLVNALATIGSEHEFFLFLNLECKNIFKNLPKNFKSIICKIPGNIRPLRILYEQIVLPVKIRSNNIDILHSLGQTTPLISFCPSVITMHDTNYWSCASHFSLYERILPRIFIRQSLFSAKHIIAVSHFTCEELIKKLNIKNEKITVVYEASNKFIKNKKEEEKNLLEKYGIRNSFLLSVASPWKHKNIAGLISIYNELLQLGDAPKLVIVGHSVEKKPEIRQELQKLQKPENVIFTGYIEQSHLHIFYKNAFVFVFPSLYEGFGLPILEAMTYGVPVVSSNAASLPEVAGDAALLADPREQVGFAKQIRRILDNKQLRDELSRRGIERSSKFSWEKCARETISVYKKVLQK